MKLSRLIAALPGTDYVPDPDKDPQITAITADSRNAGPGSLFIAVKGYETDGHQYITQAVEQGAAAILAQQGPEPGSGFPPVIRVSDSRQGMALAAAEFYGRPAEKMTLVGITGTNGKTTVSWLLESMLKAGGFNTAVMGTVNIRYNRTFLDNPVTTPDSIDLHRNLADMCDAGVTHVIMEVSSHALELFRVHGCSFHAAVFTNLTQDHLDFHPDMDHYFNSKKKLFTRYLGQTGDTPGTAVINLDDTRGKALARDLKTPAITVSRDKTADITTSQIHQDITGISGNLVTPAGSIPFRSALTGQFNLENILCAAGAAMALGLSRETIGAGISDCANVPGRLDKVANPLGLHLFVDYAHTPDALASILKTLGREGKKRLITIFGCGGDRDRSKRPLMGGIAAELSDIAIVTSDNPRTEDPDAIIRDILSGMGASKQITLQEAQTRPFDKGFLVEPDRKAALTLAVTLARPGDIVVAAGKGHENYQITNAGTLSFDDKEILAAAVLETQEQLAPIPWQMADLSKALDTPPLPSTENQSATALPQAEPVYTGIGTDSRTITPDQVFVALKGDRFDGHDFIPGLIKKDITAFVVKNGFTRSPELSAALCSGNLSYKPVFFEVPDTLHALGQLARFQRLRSKVNLVAVTGSSGKTTTRNILEQIFSTRFRTLSTAGNFNNEIGVPLTLLRLSRNHEWAVVEMGMNHQGEISRLSRMALPDIALITNTDQAHLEGLGSLDNVIRAKSEIVDGMRDNGCAVLFSLNKHLSALVSRVKNRHNVKDIVFFGNGPDSTVRADRIETQGQATCFRVEMDGRLLHAQVQSPAPFMVDNTLAAIAVARQAGIDMESIEKGIRAFSPGSGRMHIQTIAPGVTLMDDTYNANPASMKRALETLARADAACRIAVLGDMLELGQASESLHYEMGQIAADLKIDYLFLSGREMNAAFRGALAGGMDPERLFRGDKQAIDSQLKSLAAPGTWILVKGSRGMAMETIVKTLIRHINPMSERI